MACHAWKVMCYQIKGQVGTYQKKRKLVRRHVPCTRMTSYPGCRVTSSSPGLRREVVTRGWYLSVGVGENMGPAAVRFSSLTGYHHREQECKVQGRLWSYAKWAPFKSSYPRCPESCLGSGSRATESRTFLPPFERSTLVSALYKFGTCSMQLRKSIRAAARSSAVGSELAHSGLSGSASTMLVTEQLIPG